MFVCPFYRKKGRRNVLHDNSDSKCVRKKKAFRENDTQLFDTRRKRMVISKLQDIGNYKFKVYIDGEYAFLLYSTDLRRNRLEEGMEISEELYEDILVHTIYRRAKQKAMAILKRMDRTEAELRSKLKQADYRDDAIDVALEYVMKYGYVNDERYAECYIRCKQNGKSRKQIEYTLAQKGLSRELIQTAMENEYESEEEAIRRAIYKKTEDPTTMDREKKMKLIASLCRKGYSYEKIKKFF